MIDVSVDRTHYLRDLEELKRLRQENENLKRNNSWVRFSLTEIMLAAKSVPYEGQLTHIEEIARMALDKMFTEQEKQNEP